MASKKPQLNIRTDQELIDKIKKIADKERRSLAKQVEVILAKYAEEYEAQESRSEQKSKLEQSSISRTG